MSILAPVTIALVDDSDDIRALVRTRLRLAGNFRVVGEGRTGRDAIDLAAQHRPHLILLDVSMPDMDGLEALPALADASPQTRVVVFSGFDEPELERRALELGATAYIRKSLPVAQLAERLTTIGGNPVARESSPATDTASEGWSTGGVSAQQPDHFPLLFEQADAGMATLTLAGRVVRANQAFAVLVGSSRDELIGREWCELVDDEHRGRVRALVEKVAGGTSALALEHGVAGNETAALSTTLALVRDGQGAPLYLFLQTQDISEQRHTERALAQSEERFRLLVESVRDYAIFMLDPTGRIVSWNAGAARIKGCSADDVLGRHFRMFYTRDAQQARHPEHELEIAAATGRYQEEGWRVRKDGTQFWANVTITALRDETGQLVGFAKVTRDVTERERLTVARQQAAQTAELLAVIAHELRSPLGVMTGAAQTLAEYVDELLPQERTELVDALVRSGARIRRMMDDLLTASRLEARALEVRVVEVALAPLLTEATRQARASAPGGPVQVETEPVDDGLTVLADPDRLQQIVQNLINNAVRHGAPPVRIQVTADDESVGIDVVDHGPGVPEQVVDRVFDRFATGAPSVGTGLGLFIVRELARAQQGDAVYERVDGRTHFVVRLQRGGRND